MFRVFSTLVVPAALALAVLGGSDEAYAGAGLPVCGDGVVQLGERCDDGNVVDDDGCDATCEPSGVATMSHGDGVACAVTRAGHVKCWGRNDAGQLGYGHTQAIGDDETPADVDFVPLDGPATSVFTNGEQTFALMVDGSVRAWGLNDAYQLGLGHDQTIGDDETPLTSAWATTPVIGGPVVELSAQGYFACARLDAGAVRCWGRNDVGQLGYGHTQTIGDDEHPADAGDVALQGPAVELATGAHHACARLDDGRVQCWGGNDAGQLGLGHTAAIGDDEVPQAAGVVALGGQLAVQLVAGADHTCARLVGGAVRCWGDNAHGQLGYDGPIAVGDDELPSVFGDVPVGESVIALLAGAAHTCAMLGTGELRCWGANDAGQLGDGSVSASVSLGAAEPVVMESSEPTTLFSGATGDKTCALFDDDALHCWGANDGGQLGIGEPETEISGSADQFVVVVDDTIE